MTLTVETGTGLADAESYVSVAEFKAYADKFGHSYTDYSDALIEQALRRATVWLDARYRKRFKGIWTTTTQRLEWPRSGVWYRFNDIDPYTIPDQLKNALCEVALRELADPGGLSPDTGTDAIKRDRVGDTETEFRANAPGALPWLSIVDDLLADLTKGRAMAYVGRAQRG